jgi:hypothetical protein
MATRSARHTILSETATFDAKTGELRVVVETPKGSRNKYDYDPDCDCFDLATVLPEGMSFPFDFGFVPSTLGEAGDPLDILILMDAPVVPGCVIRARAVIPTEALPAESRAGVASKNPTMRRRFSNSYGLTFSGPRSRSMIKTLKVLSTAHARWQFRTPHAPANCLDTQAGHAGHRFIEIDDGGELGLA